MTQAWIGGCACGRIRYRIDGEPVFRNDCQCRDCQRESGTGHGSYLSFMHEGVSVTGEAGQWDMTADSGNTKTRYFCPVCGVAVYMTFAVAPGVFTIRAGSLDDPGRYRPQAVTYASRGHAWDRLDPDIPAFAGMPG